jgi:tRNA(fMet)-specific endonuclease VapC
MLLDTNIISALMRRHPVVMAKTRGYLDRYKRLTFSIISYYEILRGLEVKSAAVQKQRFELACLNSEILPLDETVIRRAIKIYADLYRRGQLIEDADILIAATALVHDLPLVTNNNKHFSRVPALVLQNWLDD